MKMTNSPSKFDVPVGRYLAKFLACRDDRPPHPEYGQGLEWQFEIVLPEHMRGRIASRNTALEPTTRNSCGRLLKQLAGHPIEPDDDVDIEQFKGRLYTIDVEAKDTGKGTRVGDVFPEAVWRSAPVPSRPAGTEGGNTPAPSSPRSGTGPASGPPPRKPAAPSAATPAPTPVPVPIKRYWVETVSGQPEVLMAEFDLRPWLNIQQRRPEEIPAILDGENEWKTLADYGFTQEIPF